jgi:predicted dehydrogenase
MSIRVGIIGIGRIAVDSHIPDLRKAGAEVFALADVVPGRAGRFAAQFGIPHAFDDYRQMLRREELDAVVVASPILAHEENAVAAFEAGKHVFLEKPPAATAAGMRRITAAGHKAGKAMRRRRTWRTPRCTCFSSRANLARRPPCRRSV